MNIINYWIAFLVMWVFWLIITPKIANNVIPEPLIVPVFMAVANLMPWLLESAEIIAYSMIRGP